MRPLRIQFAGAAYHLIQRANHRQPLFHDRLDRRRYLDLLDFYTGRFDCPVYAFTLLKKEIHILLETPQGNVSKLMQSLGTSYTQYFNRRHRRRGPLFEGRYKSYLIHKESSLSDLTRYIHRANFRASQSTRTRRDCPWSSYRAYLGREPADIVHAEPVLKQFGATLEEQRRGYRRFVEGGGRGNPYPARVISRQIVGPTEFAEHVLSEVQNVPPYGERSALRKAESILRALNLSLSSDEYLRLQERRSKAMLRHVAMYVIRRQTMLPLRAIGAMLGVKASAVALAIARLDRRLKQGNAPPLIRSLLDTASFAPVSAGDETPVVREMRSVDVGKS